MVREAERSGVLDLAAAHEAIGIVAGGNAARHRRWSSSSQVLAGPVAFHLGDADTDAYEVEFFHGSGGGPASDDLGGLVLGAEVGTTLLVLRTPAAHAHPVAQRIDALQDPSILGTIAGDDTVFVATSDQSGARRLAAELFPTGTTAGDA